MDLTTAQAAELIEQLRTITEELERLDAPLADCPEQATRQINRFLETLEELGGILESYGLSPTRDDFRRLASRTWGSHKREISIGELRALVYQILRKERFDLGDATPGRRDGDAAYIAAHIMANVAAELSPNADEAQFTEAFNRQFSAWEMAELVQSGKQTADAAEAVRRSISRFKNRAAGQSFYRFDDTTGRLSKVDGNSLDHARRGKAGRPRKS